MLEGIIVEGVILGSLMFILFVLCTIEFYILRRTMIKVKDEAAKTGLILRVITKKIMSFEKTIEAYHSKAAPVEPAPRYYNDAHDSIEHQYERAKRVLKHGAKDDLSKLRQCDMTDEEIELLTDLVD